MSNVIAVWHGVVIVMIQTTEGPRNINITKAFSLYSLLQMFSFSTSLLFCPLPMSVTPDDWQYSPEAISATGELRVPLYSISSNNSTQYNPSPSPSTRYFGLPRHNSELAERESPHNNSKFVRYPNQLPPNRGPQTKTTGISVF